jgi:hypothetical protein
MKKINTKSLTLATETIRNLADAYLTRAVGGVNVPSVQKDTVYGNSCQLEMVCKTLKTTATMQGC